MKAFRNYLNKKLKDKEFKKLLKKEIKEVKKEIRLEMIICKKCFFLNCKSICETCEDHSNFEPKGFLK